VTLWNTYKKLIFVEVAVEWVTRNPASSFGKAIAGKLRPPFFYPAPLTCTKLGVVCKNRWDTVWIVHVLLMCLAREGVLFQLLLC